MWASGGNTARQVYVDPSRTANNRILDSNWSSGSYTMQFVNDAFNASVKALNITGGQAAGHTLTTWPTVTSHVIGHTAAVTIANQGRAQLVGTTDATAQSQVSRHSADASGPALVLGKSRNATAGSNTIVVSGDVVGRLIGYGANGSSYTPAAQLSMEIDGAPGATNDMPGRLVASTTPDGSGTLTEAWRVDSTQLHIFQKDRAIRFNNQTSAAGAAVGTLNNAPTAGDPGHWLKINVGGVNYALPAWAG